MSVKRLAHTALGTVAILVVLITLSVLAVGTEAGTQWSLRLLQRLVPNLELDQASGSWRRGLDIAELRWQAEAGEVQIEHLQIRLSLPSLLTGTLHLPVLAAQTMEVHPAPAKSESAATELPSISLPFAVKLEKLQLDHLSINGAAIAHAVSLGLYWRGSHLTIDEAAFAWDGGKASIAGELWLTDEYALSLDGTVRHEALPGDLSARLRGSLRTLEISATLDGRWPVHARGQVQPLQAGLPLSLELATAEPITLGSDAQTLRLDSATLSVSGELEQLVGKLRLEFHEEHYGPGQLHADLHWQEDHLTISQAYWELADGSQPLRGDCSASLSDRQWRCEGHLLQLSLSPWLEGRAGHISTPWQASGSVREGMALTLALSDIRGKLDNAALSGEIRVATDEGKRWQVQRLKLSAGHNTVSASGILGEDSSMEFRAQLPQLAQLYPPLQGSVELNATVKGKLSAPDIGASLNARSLVYGDRRIAQLTAKLQAPQLAQKNSTLQVSIDNALIDEARAPLSAVIQGSGSRRRQQWQLQARESDGSELALNCQHTATPELSDGHLQCAGLDGRIALRQHTLPLALAQTLDIRWQRSEPSVAIEPFCLSAGEARLCLEQASKLPPSSERPLNVSLSNVPLEWLTAYAPQPVELTPGTQLNASLTVEQWLPLQARAQVQIPRISWPNPRQENAVVATIDAINALLTVTPEEATLKATARSAELGDLTLDTTVSEPSGSRVLNGQLRIRGLQTGAFAWLLPDDYQAAGQLDASLQLGGQFSHPELSGTITLIDGMVSIPQLEDSIRELGLRIELEDRRAGFKGKFQLGSGSGEVSGVLQIPEQWQQWRLQADLLTRAIQFSPLPDSNLTLSSALTLQADASAIRLGGDVTVDRADIQIRQLPPDTQRVSSDAEIVGGGSQTGPELFMNLRLDLGERFHFAGLGADVDLGGKLQLSQQPQRSLSAHGEVRITRGRYRAYGQRLTVRRGSFVFNGPLDNPDIDLRALRDMPPDSKIEVGVDVTGTLRNPLAVLYSNPPMAETETAYYLLTGKPPPEFGQATQLSAESALLSIGVAGASARAARVAEKIGISDFQISAAESEQGTEAQLSGYLTPRLYVRYGTGLQEGANSVTFQYRVTRQLLLEAVTGLDQALDILYSFNVK